MGASLRRRIALAAVAPAALALAAVDVFAVRAARDAERAQVERRLRDAAGVVEEEKRFFLAAPQNSAEISRRIARIAGFEYVLQGREGAPALSSLDPVARAEALETAARLGEEGEITAAGARYLARRVDLEGRSLLLLFPMEAVDRAGRRAAFPVLAASAVGLLAAAVAAAVLGTRIARPIGALADAAARVARGEAARVPPSPPGAAPEVEDLRAALERMLAALGRAEEERVHRERLAVLGEFAAGVAHEVRNPLSSLRMSLQLAAEEVGESRRGDLDAAVREMDRLDRSVGELLQFAGTVAPRGGEFAPGRAADEAARLHGALADHLGVGIALDTGGAPPAFHGDGDVLRTVVGNLVLNAVQASPRGASVDVRVAAGEGGGLSLQVADRGPGIPAAVGDRVFEPFFSGRPGGTGLGLALVRRLVEAHGGTVTWRSGPAGTTFDVHLSPLPGATG